MTLHVDDAAEQMLAQLMYGLRSERLRAGITQEALAAGLPFRGRAISEWETGAVSPTLDHLNLLTSKLGQRLVIVGADGEPRTGPLRQRSGETRQIFDRRRLASPLRIRRQALGMTQEELCELVGVTRDSIQRWELAHVPPRPIALAVWARTLGYSIALRQIGAPDRRLRPAMAASRRPSSTKGHKSRL